MKNPMPFSQREAQSLKLAPSLEEAIRRSGLQNGMTISFHHHFREGDQILNQVMEVIDQMGFRNLKVASSSLSDVHAPLLKHIQNGVVTSIESSGCRGSLAEAISAGALPNPMIFRSHGGRAAAIANGQLKIDVAFLGASVADAFGNAAGTYAGPLPEGVSPSLCGSLGYAKVDARYALQTIVLTNCLLPYPCVGHGISESDVDWVILVDSIGDSKKISAGATRYSQDPRNLLIARKAAQVIMHSGFFYNGFSLQTGTGGASLAVTRYLREVMLAGGIKARYALGGITAAMVQLHEEGFIEKLMDVQDFDLEAARSLARNPHHYEVDGNQYANPYDAGSLIHQLDVVVLSALEVDEDFNVNVLTGSDGVIRGAVGGHPDTASGAALTVVVTPLLRGRIPCVVERVTTLCTPGEDVDVLVTDRGIAVNPSRPEVAARLERAGIILTGTHQLRTLAESIAGKPEPLPFGSKVIAHVLAPDGTLLDTVREIGHEKSALGN
jgi:citrate lyase subunit alpha/citrate CoA-transferase